ncbi:transglycosylase domain-containing protein [Clostridium estertheticum]|uniref:transglycosylase domain-containing protein n=1 Tax=Clostridium estertheticum TaxID=238834 RepID=UPI001CF1D4A7|nr:transglycosylase domain-containing protein [Clostridium estertheticum]MCB2346976.1 transglycosylase domain-containing protein [Clostridium estertheticum]
MNDNAKIIEPTKIKKKLWKKVVKCLLIFFVVIFLSVSAASGYIYIKYNAKIKSTIAAGNTIAKNINDTAFNTRKPTQVYDNKGVLLKEFKTNSYYYTKDADLNPYISQAVTSIEDERFYEHNGIDYKGIRRSIWVYIKSKGAVLYNVPYRVDGFKKVYPVGYFYV